jgi:hypothetical protein
MDNEDISSKIENEFEKKFNEMVAEDEKILRETPKDYEPYDLKEIKTIIGKAKERAAKEPIHYKIEDYLIALEKINLIINNNDLLYKKLESGGYINEPESYYSEREIVLNLRKQF